jgi:hypothetical protein
MSKIYFGSNGMGLVGFPCLSKFARQYLAPDTALPQCIACLHFYILFYSRFVSSASSLSSDPSACHLPPPSLLMFSIRLHVKLQRFRVMLPVQWHRSLAGAFGCTSDRDCCGSSECIFSGHQPVVVRSQWSVRLLCQVRAYSRENHHTADGCYPFAWLSWYHRQAQRWSQCIHLDPCRCSSHA